MGTIQAQPPCRANVFNGLQAPTGLLIPCGLLMRPRLSKPASLNNVLFLILYPDSLQTPLTRADFEQISPIPWPLAKPVLPKGALDCGALLDLMPLAFTTPQTIGPHAPQETAPATLAHAVRGAMGILPLVCRQRDTPLLVLTHPTHRPRTGRG